MRALGVDLGQARIGLAVSAGSLAVPHETIERSGDPTADRTAILDAARSADCDTIVVGLPRSLDGSDGPAAQAALAEIEALRAAADGLEVLAHDERLTTVIAQQHLRDAGLDTRAQRSRIDESAATVLLQSWLEART